MLMYDIFRVRRCIHRFGLPIQSCEDSDGTAMSGCTLEDVDEVFRISVDDSAPSMTQVLHFFDKATFECECKSTL